MCVCVCCVCVQVQEEMRQLRLDSNGGTGPTAVARRLEKERDEAQRQLNKVHEYRAIKYVGKRGNFFHLQGFNLW